MMKQLKQIFDPDISLSFSTDRKYDKSSSTTDILTMHPKSKLKFLQLNEDASMIGSVLGVSERKNSRSPPSDQFLFCLKLKMIGISKLFDNTEQDSEKFDGRNANQILNELSRKIKNYQKDTTKRLNQQTKRVKQLQIVIINLQAQIKSLQSDLAFSKKQFQRNKASYTNDIQRLRAKIKQYEQNKQSMFEKMRTSSQIIDEQTQMIISLEAKIKQLDKINQKMENNLFEKEKQKNMLTNQMNLQKIKYLQQIEGLKKSVMKKAEQNIKLSNEVNNLKEVVDSKQIKIEESRVKYNKLNAEHEKLQYNFNQLNQQYGEFKTKAQQMAASFQKEIKKFEDQQQKVSNFANEIVQKMQVTFGAFKQIAQRIDQVRIYQHNLQTQIQWMSTSTQRALNQLSQSYMNQQQFLRDEFNMQIRMAVQEVEQKYLKQKNQMQNYLIYLEKQLQRK